jgi:hypothetical protein
LSTTELRVIPGGREREFRFTATRVALEMEAHLDTDPWALGDALLKDIGIIGAGSNDPTKTGLFAKVDEIRNEMLEVGALTVAKKTGTLTEAYRTARHWPPEHRRPDIATYFAHARFRNKDYQGERGAKKLEQLHRKTKGRRVTPDDVRLWREAQQRAAGNMPAPLSRDEMLDRKLRTALRGWASPQTFAQLHEDEQETAAALLQRLAGEIRRGEFS